MIGDLTFATRFTGLSRYALSPVSRAAPAMQNGTSIPLHGAATGSAIAGGVQTWTGNGLNIAAYPTASHPIAPHIALSLIVDPVAAPACNVQAGPCLFKDDLNYIATYLAFDNLGNCQLVMEAWQGGAQTVFLSPTVAAFVVPCTVTLTCVFGVVRAWFNTGAGDVLMGTLAFNDEDFRDPAVLATYVYAYAAGTSSAGANASISAHNFRTGYAGLQGMREQFPVRESFAAGDARNMRPKLTGDTLYFTADNCQADNAVSFPTELHYAHMGMWTMDCTDPAAPVLTEVSKLFFLHGGKIYAEQDGRVVWDNAAGLWRGIVNTWDSTGDNAGTFGYVNTLYFETAADITTGVHVLTPTRTLSFSCGDVSTYDVDLRHDDADDALWHFAYVASDIKSNFANYGPRYDTTTDFTTFANVSSEAPNANKHEGAHWARVGGVWSILTASHTGAFPIYVPATMLSTSTLAAPVASYSLEPHPNLFSLPGGWMLVTFDGTEFGTSLLCVGNLVLMQAAQTGNEFPWG